MASQGFSYDSIFIRMLNRVGDAFFLSILFTITSIPIITIGPSISALYYTAMKGVQGDDGYIWKNYIKSFKENFKQATLMWLMFMAAFFVLGVDVWFWYTQIKLGANFVVKSVAVVSVVMLLVAIFICIYAFPLQAKFDNKISVTLRNAFLLSIKNFPITVLILFISFVVAWTFYYQPAVSICGYPLIGFGVVGYLYAFLMLRCFKPYLETDTEEHASDMDWKVDASDTADTQDDDDEEDDESEEEEEADEEE